MKKLVILPLLSCVFLAGCATHKNEQPAISGIGIITTGEIPVSTIPSQAQTFLDQIPECNKIYSGEVIDIEKVITNCTTKEKQGREPDGLGGVYPNYKIFSGQIGESRSFCINRNGNDEEFAQDFDDNSSDYSPTDPTKYLCKETSLGDDGALHSCLYLPYSGDAFSASTKKSAFLSSHPLLSLISIPLDYSISDLYCPYTDKECSTMLTQGLRTDKKNYFAGGIGSVGYGSQSIYLINDHFYNPGISDSDLDSYNFYSQWAFAGIQDNKIIVKRIINGTRIGEFGMIKERGEYGSKTKYTLKTCEIPLP